MISMNISSRITVCLLLVSALAACGKAPENPPPAPASATAPAPATAPTPAASSVAAASTAPAPASVPAATTAAAAGTTAAPADASDSGPEIAGSVALAQGSVTDTATDGSSRQLKDGDSVYPGDAFVLGQDSYLDLDFEDGGRILLRPNTNFQIQSYHFDPDAHGSNLDANGQPLIKPASTQPESAFFKLVKGGLRAIDGLIGHTTPQNYGVETPVATIGVRGTAFDVRYCGDDCADESDASGKPENGLYTSVSEGTVAVKNDSGEAVTPAGHSGFVKSRKERLQALATPPKALRHMDLPEKLKPRAEKNRGQIKVKRQQRRQRILERRRQAAEKLKARGKPGAAAAKGKPETLKERREERREKKHEAAGQKPGQKPSPEKLERIQKRGQERDEQKQTASPGAGKPAARGQAQELTPRENLREQRQQQREQKLEQKQQQGHAAEPAAQPKSKAEQKPAGKQGQKPCKGKRKKQLDKDKDKDKCGDG